MARAILLAGAEEERLKQLLRMDRRFLRDASQPLLLPENAFVGHYRLTKAQFETLCEDVIPLLPVTQRISAVRPDIKVLAALAFYANGCYQKNLGAYYHIGLSQTAVSDCLRDVTKALNDPRILAKYIIFPRTRADREAVSRRFMDQFGFPGVVGCVDGSHVAIIRPLESEEAYYNRKHFHSLNVLLICDADMRVLHVDASFGGQSHDSHVWNNCPVQALMQDAHADGEVCWLLGDSGYAQRPWMMTPILNAVPGSPEAFYTSTHVRTRNVVERCIGVLKACWRCLLAHRVMHYAPIKAGKITNACVVLHNLINDARITIDEEEVGRDRAQQPQPEAPEHQQRHTDDGGREAVVDRLWRNRVRQ